MKFSRSFTLIELLIVFAIIAILSGLTLASYRTSAEAKNLESEVRRLGDTLKLAYKKGSSSETGPLALCTDFRGYTVTVQPAEKQYILRKCCEAACNSAQSTVLSTYVIPQSSLEITAPPVQTTYLFEPLAAQTTVQPAGNTTITLRNTGLQQCISLEVGGAGNIQEHAKIDC